MASWFSRRDSLPAGLRANQIELSGNMIRIHARSGAMPWIYMQFPPRYCVGCSEELRLPLVPREMGFWSRAEDWLGRAPVVPRRAH